jgi:minor extracellular serine protease Vpr
VDIQARGTIFRWLLVLAFVLTAIVPALANSGTPSVDVSQLQVPEGTASGGPGPLLLQPSGEVQVVVTLADPPLATAVGEQAKQQGSKLNGLQQNSYLSQLGLKQNALMAQVRGFGGRDVTRLSKALNAVIVTIDAKYINDIAALPNVVSVHRVKDYELDLSETVPYIGASAVQASGVDGTGVRVAILDSGIDYTHKNLGGSGLLVDYLAAYGITTTDSLNTTRDGLFPTAKVIGGYDLVGEGWPTTALAPDPDPIDCGPSAIGGTCAGGHGTHVADIVAGKSLDGAHVGVAPGASLYAVKVCSSISTSCSGVALLQGMDFALDPNGDGDISDAVDVVNMSLGSDYGMVQDDLTLASNNAAKLGVVVVAAAGNAADRPYIVSSPSIGKEVISVAQTQVPSAMLYKVETAVTTAKGAGWQAWSAAPVLSTGLLQYADGAGGNKLGCSAFAAGSLTGKIVLLDRGTCAISIKVSNVAAGGGLAALVANNASQAPGDLPPDFSYGGGTPSIPGYSMTQVDGAYLQANALGATATIDPASAASLVKNMVASSARGPSMSTNSIKPDIGAPGASLSAEAGTGSGQTVFGGTSGATPMIAGSAALLIDKHPARTPREIKSLLMNTARINLGINPVALPGVLAPITRIGAGEVRVDQAAATKTAAWDLATGTPSLSFGYNALYQAITLTKTVVVRNYSILPRSYTIANRFRYADDAASGAVSLQFPGNVWVPAMSATNFNLVLVVHPGKLPTWTLNGGSYGGDGYRLQSVEFDGFLTISGGADVVHVPWQVLPHKAANVAASPTTVPLWGGNLKLTNVNGKVDGRFDVFSLTGTSPKLPGPLPGPGDNVQVVDLKSVGVRLAGTAVQFAINTFGERAHPNYPAEFDVYVDSNNDGTPDFVIYNAENGGFGASGQNVVAVANLTTGVATIYYYADADLDSANMIMTAPLSALGLTATSKFTFSVYAFDNYYTGSQTDAIKNMTYTLGTPHYSASMAAGAVPINGSTNVTISAVPGGATASPSQSGFLLLYRDAKPKAEASEITVKP